MTKISEMATRELFYATLRSLRADQAAAASLRTGVTSGTGKSIYSDKVRDTAEVAHKRMTEALRGMIEFEHTFSTAVAAYNVARRAMLEEERTVP